MERTQNDSWVDDNTKERLLALSNVYLRMNSKLSEATTERERRKYEISMRTLEKMADKVRQDAWDKISKQTTEDDVKDEVVKVSKPKKSKPDIDDTTTDSVYGPVYKPDYSHNVYGTRIGYGPYANGNNQNEDYEDDQVMKPTYSNQGPWSDGNGQGNTVYIDTDLKTTSYKQGDWDLEMTGGKNVKDIGCFLTCGAMVLGKTPEEHLNELKPLKKDNGYDWQFAASKENKKAEVRFHYSREDNFDELKQEIGEHIHESGNPVIIMISRTQKDTKYRQYKEDLTHFIVAKGIQGEFKLTDNGEIDFLTLTEDMILVNDPAANRTTLADSLRDSKNYKDARVSSMFIFK